MIRVDVDVPVSWTVTVLSCWLAGLKNPSVELPFDLFQSLLIQLLLGTAITRSFCSDPGATALGVVGCGASCGFRSAAGDQLLLLASKLAV